MKTPNLFFKDFLLNEDKQYFSTRIGDLLAAIQELAQDSPHLGTRDLTRFSEKIVDQIRTILHSQWDKEEQHNLKKLQKIGVAIMRSIEEKDDLKAIIASATHELEKMSGKLGKPIHQMDDTEPDEPKEKGISKPEKKKPAEMSQPGVLPMPKPPNSSTKDEQPPLGGNSGPLDAF